MESVKEITNIIASKNYLKRYIVLTIALFISAINYSLFILPCKFVTGGTNGIATISNYVFNLDPSLTIFLISFVLLIFCFIYLGKEDTLAAGYITIVYPLFVKITSSFNEALFISYDDKLLIAIFTGLLAGISSGLIYKVGLNTGGMGILAKIIAGRNKKSVSTISMTINLSIVLVGAFVFGMNVILYSFLILAIDKYFSERILLGMSTNKTFYIISNKYLEIKKVLMEELKHDVTLFNTKGKYLDNNQKLLMCVIPNSEYFLVKELIKKIDDKAFVTITDSYEAKGQDVKIKSLS